MSTEVHEIGIALEWYMSVLSGDDDLTSVVTGGIHRTMAPPDTIAPWVIVGYMSGSDITTMQEVRIFSPLLFQVKVVGPAAMMATLVSAASEIDRLLKRTSGNTSDGFILSTYREQPLQLDEVRAGGVIYTNIGGLYRTIIQQISS